MSVIFFRRGLDQLEQAQFALARTGLHNLLEPTPSYVSVVELGMYEMTAKMHATVGASHKAGSDEFDAAFDAEMETQRQRVMSRLFLDLPGSRYVCFYPMNKRRGAATNWYSASFGRPPSMMPGPGRIGRA